MKFLDVKTDYAFKKVFGGEDSEKKLISFFNAFLGEENKDKYIKEFQVLCSDELVIKALSIKNLNFFIRFKNISNIYNASLSTNMKEIDLILKENNYKWSKFDYFLNIFICSDLIIFKSSKESYVSFMQVQDKYTMKVDLQYFDCFLEIDKFNKKISQLETIQDEWLYFIKNAGSLEYVPNGLNKEIKNALESVNEANLTKDEREQLEKRKELVMIQKSAISKAMKDGIEEGKKEKAIEIAKKVGLTIDDIEKIRR